MQRLSVCEERHFLDVFECAEVVWREQSAVQREGAQTARPAGDAHHVVRKRTQSEWANPLVEILLVLQILYCTPILHYIFKMFKSINLSNKHNILYIASHTRKNE